MRKLKIPFYVVKASGRAYWVPNTRMRSLGFKTITCGVDGPGAQATGLMWNERWRAVATVRAAGDARRPGFIYFLRTTDRVKIGFSVNPFSRTGDMAAGLSDDVISLGAVRGTISNERTLHRELAADRIRGEWFRTSPAVLEAMRVCFARETNREPKHTSD